MLTLYIVFFHTILFRHVYYVCKQSKRKHCTVSKYCDVTFIIFRFLICSLFLCPLYLIVVCKLL